MSALSLLIVDDEPGVINSIIRRLRNNECIIYGANSAHEGLQKIQELNIDVVLSDQMMPIMDGISFLKKVKEYDPDIIRLLITGNGSMENIISAINNSYIFGYLSKPWSDEDLTHIIDRAFEQRRLIIENKRLLKLTSEQNLKLIDLNNNLEQKVLERTRELEIAVDEGIILLSHAAEAKDDDTGDHINRIKSITQKICLKLGMPESKAEKIGLYSIMHDIGKIHIPDKILKKPGPLDTEEWLVMKKHTIFGEKILGVSSYYKTAREIAKSHHERWDGSGYPDGLKGENIPIAARIVTVADVFDALTNERPYKQAWPVEEAITEMKKMSGKLFDPEILAIFLNIIENNENRR
jgi:putative two-component system response regulator